MALKPTPKLSTSKQSAPKQSTSKTISKQSAPISPKPAVFNTLAANLIKKKAPAYLKPVTKASKPVLSIKATKPVPRKSKLVKSIPFSPLPSNLPEEFVGQLLQPTKPTVKTVREIDWDLVTSIHDIKAILSTLNLSYAPGAPELSKIGYLTKQARPCS